MKCSIVMATYNGEKYIYEQLYSIFNQTRTADEVLIFDDNSSDNTVSICHDFILDNNVLNWSIQENNSRLGWQKNFINGMSNAENEIIFLADQDDIWENDKIEKMMAVMENKGYINILACGLKPIYEKTYLKHVSVRTMRKYGIRTVEKVKLNRKWLEPCRPGCTFCIRKEKYDCIKQLWFEECPHDLLIWAVGVYEGGLYILNEQLVKQRRHANVNTPSNKKNNGTREKLLKIDKEIIENLIGFYSAQSSSFLSNQLNFCEKRYLAQKGRKTTEQIKMLKYLTRYPKVTSWLGDFISIYR